ncbi:hypothetical protein [Pelagicoccus sp. SDUM812003]|uniref:hypothetical protein n=1 Tax=Pelagicoccus sp. SDUM812003 TaxID=3041267 RepID=UPI0028104AA6|nr:hypothetical protein [Pelagicoccus sp. SDUM812003]MDQ8204952.1 hypothetical protein [Pelagicoccus sp. SDUM812003]
MSSVASRLKAGIVGSLLIGGCLLSFWAGRMTADGTAANLEREGGKPLVSETLREQLGSRDVGTEQPAKAAAAGEERARPTNVFPSARSERELSRQREAFRELAFSDPERAFALAERAASRIERKALKEAAFEGWGARDPEAAIRFALEQDIAEQDSALKHAMLGAAEQPGSLLAVYSQLADDETFPTHLEKAAERGVCEALLTNGHFEEAVAFAGESASRSQSQSMLRQSFSTWARWEPETALVAALDLQRRADRELASEVALGSWSQSDPGMLAEFAAELPEGEVREQALRKSLSSWVSQDPAEAADWLATREPAKELDAGLLALVNHPYLAERRPEVALGWAESLWDAGLRADAVSRVVKQWAATDRQAAVAYLKGTDELSLLERRELLALFGERMAFGIDGEAR